MKKILILTILTNISFARIEVRPRVIYGIDDRFDVYESPDSLMRELSHSVAAQITDYNLEEDQEKHIFTLVEKTLEDNGVCKDEKYASQPANGNCSGFLVEDDVLITAGHCVSSVESCQNHKWIFDYAYYDHPIEKFEFNQDQIFSCVELIAREKDNTTGIDYSVIRLDRKVLGRRPFKMRSEGKLSDDAVLTVLGFPSGIPLKITTGAVVRKNDKDEFFVINSDTYGGNSGSAVIDTRTGIVEGILVRGDDDYNMDPENECMRSVVREQDNGRGEDATRITSIKFKQHFQ